MKKNNPPTTKGKISLCPNCNCMTKTIGNHCGKCKADKDIDVTIKSSPAENMSDTCQKHVNSGHVEDWEKEFDMKFTDRGNYVYQAEIKDFIRQLLKEYAKKRI